MKYAENFGFKSAKVLLGTGGFGTGTSQSESFELMDKYVYLGGNHFDTARIYGMGKSEEVIGEWLKNKNRSEYVVSTKGAHPELETMHVSRLSEAEVRSDLEASLKALQTDYVDIYWLHRDDEKIPAGQIVEMLNQFVKEGKVRKIGCSNWTVKRIEEANSYAAAHSLQGFVASQIRFSPAFTVESYIGDDTLVEMNAVEYDYYLRSGMPVVAYEALAKGFFSKYLSTAGRDSIRKDILERYDSEENREKVKIMAEICKKYGISPASAVCAAHISNKAVHTFPIIGSRTVEQLVDALSGADTEFTEEEVRLLIAMG